MVTMQFKIQITKEIVFIYGNRKEPRNYWLERKLIYYILIVRRW